MTLRHTGNRFIMFQKGYFLSEEFAKNNVLTVLETGGSVATTALSLLEYMGFKRQPKADLQIKQSAAEVTIRTTNSQLNIDSSQARRDLGLIGPLESSRNYAQKGKQAVLAGIARRAREGEQLASIENGGNAIQAIAASKATPQKKALGIKFVPSIGSVKTTYTPASIDINVQTNKAQISATVNKPIHNYTQGKGGIKHELFTMWKHLSITPYMEEVIII